MSENVGVLQQKNIPLKELIDAVGSRRALFLILLPSLLLFSRVLADITVVLTAFGFLYVSWRTKEWGWAKQYWFRLSLLLVLWQVLVTPFAYMPLTSLGYSLAYLRWPLFAAAIAVWVLRDREAILLFGAATAVTLAFLIFDCFWQFVHGVDLFGIEKFNDVRLTGPLGDPKPGNITLRLYFVGLLAVITLLSNWRLKGKLNLLMISLALLIIFEFATGERISFLLALASVAIIVATLVFARLPVRKILLFWVAMTALGVGAFSWFYPALFERFFISLGYALANFEHDHYGIIFSTGLDIWKQHPFIGVGLGNYAEYCDALMRMPDINNCGRHPHNIYLHWMAAAGLAGTLLFGASMTALFMVIFKGLKASENWLLTGFVIATLFVSFWPLASSSSFFNNWFGATIWCTLGWALAVSRNNALWPECMLDTVEHDPNQASMR